jgi:hypothetical protein
MQPTSIGSLRQQIPLNILRPVFFFLIVSSWSQARGSYIGRLATIGHRSHSLPFPEFEKLAHVGYAEYAQTAPFLYLLALNNQQMLRPVRVRQFTAGIDLTDMRLARITIETYQKRYANYPAVANYPQLSMANIVGTFGQAFLMFPMK